MTLRSALTRSLTKGFIIFGLLACAVMLMDMQPQAKSGTAMEQYNGPSYPEQLAEKHDCWVGEAPEGVTPTHVILRKPGQVAASYSADVTYALDHVFAGKHAGAQVHAFCA